MRKLKGIFRNYVRSCGRLHDDAPLGDQDEALLERRRKEFVAALRQRLKTVIPWGYISPLLLLLIYGAIFYFIVDQKEAFLRLDGPLGAVLLFQIAILRMVQKFLTEKQILDTIITVFEFQTPKQAADLADKLFKETFSGITSHTHVEDNSIKKENCQKVILRDAEKIVITKNHIQETHTQGIPSADEKDNV